MTDPRFPNRPDHPDFWLMSQALIDADKVADAGQEIPDIIGQVVDPDSLRYVAEQRALRALGPSAPHRSFAMAVALWMGTRFQHLKTAQAQEFRADEFRVRGAAE